MAAKCGRIDFMFLGSPLTQSLDPLLLGNIKGDGKLPSVTLNAFEDNKAKERIKCFKKHVEVRFTEVPTEVLQRIRITVDRKPVDKDIPCHRYYTMSENEKKITVFAKHFSKIQFMNCDEDPEYFNSFIKARICKRKNSSPNLLELKVFLTTVNKYLKNF